MLSCCRCGKPLQEGDGVYARLADPDGEKEAFLCICQRCLKEMWAWANEMPTFEEEHHKDDKQEAGK